MRQNVLNKYFEKERSHMISYYQQKSKKAKKFKTLWTQLTKIQDETKFLVLRHFYEGMVANENLISAVNICAYKRDQREKALKEEGFGTGFYAEDEHRNLLALERNLRTTQTFLFKGTKEVGAVGGEDEVDLYDLNVSAKKLKLERLAQ